MSDLSARTEAIADHYLADEDKLVRKFTQQITPDVAERKAVTTLSTNLINKIRGHEEFNRGLDAFMAEYSLDSSEGVRLMTLAEALARIPDEDTKEALIRSKLTGADWSMHLGKSISPFVNSSTRALLFTSSVLESDEIPFVSAAIRKLGEPTIRMAIEMGMGLFSDHFVLGETLEEAKKKVSKEKRQYRYSFDMLGEAALTAADARKFFEEYKKAIQFAAGFPKAAVSIKLSALHPRYDANQWERVHTELYPALDELIGIAAEEDVQITIDAEEATRLELSLQVFEKLVTDGNGKGFDKLGLAVQAYSKRAMAVLEYLHELSEQQHQRICVRLVKGAYWDTEIKLAQMMGLEDFPVFTKKAHTDICYLACARYLIANKDNLYPQFATHNVHTVANLLHWTEGQESMFEFQRLHGMGSILYDCLLDEDPDIACTIYAPIGQQKELLPYLIRRLLENSANSSFVNQLASDATAEELSRHPIDVAATTAVEIKRPGDLYPARKNSSGIDPRYSRHRIALMNELGSYKAKLWRDDANADFEVTSPIDGSVVGKLKSTDPGELDAIVARAKAAGAHWQQRPAIARAQMIRNLADQLEENRTELIALMIAEGGKTIEDGIAEVREAVDFCRYYASQMETLGNGELLPGPNGERNQLGYTARGVFVCISPWNFPVAIFTGQVVAALVTGNAVIAKPAEQTPLIAKLVDELTVRAGIPAETLQVVVGGGELGAALVNHPDIDGVAFTGSVETAKAIHRSLAAKPGPITPLVAETGGQNTMIVDSSALPEQVVKDVITSAFNSTGQRCSALRVLYLQESCADAILELLTGAMEELRIGHPGKLDTDVGPVIDHEALARLERHEQEVLDHGKLLARTPMPGFEDERKNGTWLAPSLFEIDGIKSLAEENFGPILHVVRYDIDDLDKIIDDINSTRFGLTFGVHSRNETFCDYVTARINCGNLYVNRNMVGAVVGTQPFGGRGLSGTGPKAGGPNYLKSFLVEQARTDNTAAMGGAIDLINQHS